MSNPETTSPAADSGTRSLPLEPGRWQVDPTHSGITFSIRHLGISKVRGRFDTFDAWLQVGETLADTQVEATIEMASVDTNNADRDNHLRGVDFFDVENHPQMIFRSTSISGDDDEWHMDGEVTVMGKTSPFSLHVDFYGVQVFELDGSTRAGFGVNGKLKRSEMDLEFVLPAAGNIVLGDVVTFDLDLQFVAPSS